MCIFKAQKTKQQQQKIPNPVTLTGASFTQLPTGQKEKIRRLMGRDVAGGSKEAS